MSREYEQETGRQLGRYVEAPADWIREDGYPNTAIYLAGNLGGEDWQETLRCILAPDWYAVLNPRRSRGSWMDVAEQRAWETEHLRLATRVAFWFASDADGSDWVAAMQLGEVLTTAKRMAVGIDPAHPNREAIRETVYRLRNEVEVVDNLAALAAATLRARMRPARQPRTRR